MFTFTINPKGKVNKYQKQFSRQLFKRSTQIAPLLGIWILFLQNNIAMFYAKNFIHSFHHEKALLAHSGTMVRNITKSTRILVPQVFEISMLWKVIPFFGVATLMVVTRWIHIMRRCLMSLQPFGAILKLLLDVSQSLLFLPFLNHNWIGNALTILAKISTFVSHLREKPHTYTLGMLLKCYKRVIM